MAEHPQLYMSFHDITDRQLCVLKNDQGERFTVTRAAAGDVAIMLAEFCDDPDLCDFVADEWAGHGDELRWNEEEESDDLLDQEPGSLDEVDDNSHSRMADRKDEP